MSNPVIARFFLECASRASDTLDEDVHHPVRRRILSLALASYKDERADLLPAEQETLDDFFSRVQTALEGSA